MCFIEASLFTHYIYWQMCHSPQAIVLVHFPIVMHAFRPGENGVFPIICPIFLHYVKMPKKHVMGFDIV